MPIQSRRAKIADDWNPNNYNVLIIAGKFTEEFALKYGICILPNRIKLIPCRYLAVYSENVIKYLFEIVKQPTDDATAANTREIREIAEFEGTKGRQWIDGREEFRMFTVQKIIDVGPIINDYISPTTGKLAPLTRGTPRYTLIERIKTAKLTSELKCNFDDEESMEEPEAPTILMPQQQVRKIWPWVAGIAGGLIIAAAIILYFVLKPPPPPPTKPKPVVVEKKEEPKVFELKGNSFDPGKWEIKKESIPTLENILTLIQAYPEWKLKIVGHTDDVGKMDDNIKLSLERAKSVRNWFIAHGTDSLRILYEGRGPMEPKADNSTPEGRNVNRRTEITIISK